jgi:hypothetical protein
MNKTFNINRFWRLFIKHTAEHYRTYLMSIAVLAGVMLLGGGFIIYMVPRPMDAGFQSIVFVFLMLISGTIFTSTVFSDAGDKRKAIPMLTLPASQFEKFLVGWIYSYPVFIVVYTSIFYVVLLGLINMKHWPHYHTEVLNVFQGRIYIIVAVFSMLHAITLFGAILFEKLHFIKTAFCFFISYAVLILANTLFLKALIGRDIMAAIPFGLLNFAERDKYYSVDIDYRFTNWVLLLIMGLALLFWVAAYFRLKEKQV